MTYMPERAQRQMPVPTFKQRLEVILFVFAVFLAALFVFSVGLGGVDMRGVFVALTVTYIVLHLWEKRLDA